MDNKPLGSSLISMIDDTVVDIPDPFIKYNNPIYNGQYFGTTSTPYRPEFSLPKKNNTRQGLGTHAGNTFVPNKEPNIQRSQDFTVNYSDPKSNTNGINASFGKQVTNSYFNDNFASIQPQQFNSSTMNNNYEPWNLRNSPNMTSNNFEQSINFQNYLSRSPLPVVDRPAPVNDYSQYKPVENINILTNNLSEEEKIKEQAIRGDYAAKYAKLRENFPNMEIVGPKEEWSVGEIIARFEGYAKTIQTEASVEHNQMYLLVLWTVIQVVGTRWCGLTIRWLY